MTKLFATDFDGTLYFRDEPEPIRQADRDAIAAFQQAGGLFGVCTGRPLHALTKQTWGDVPFDFYISSTGSCIFDRDLNPILHSTIPTEVARELYERLKGYAAHGSVLVCADDDYWTTTPPAGEFAHFLRYAPSFDEIPHPLQGVAFETETEEIAAQAVELVNERFAEHVVAYQNLASIDVVPAGHSKGSGLRAAAKFYGASCTAGMGDSFNDLPLLEAADIAYTFHSCDPRMKVAATVLVDTAGEALRDFLAR